jgi:EmrB/QacA subfamily drug resistance transporter
VVRENISSKAQDVSEVNPYKALFILCTAAFLVPFTGSAINLALPDISVRFSLNAVTLTWISTSYLISTAIFQVPFARIADLVGRKRIFLLGIVLFTLSSCFCGLATSGAMLIAFRALAGLGSAMLFSTNIAILTSVFPANKRGFALGINTVVVYLSLASGPFFGGMLTHYFGWQSLFYGCALMGLLVITLLFPFLKGEWIEAKGEKFDWCGSFIYAVALFGVVYGFTRLTNVVGIVCLCISILGFILFAKHENRHSFPVFNLNIFKKNKVFIFSSLAALINYSATFAISFMLSLYLQYIRGYDAHTAGTVLISQALVQAFFSYFAGKYSDRYSPFKLATSGMSIIVAGICGLIFLSDTTPIAYLIVLLILLGVGFGVFSSPNMNIIMSSVDKKQYGQASATAGTARLVGQTLSMSIATVVIYTQVGREKIVPELYPRFLNSMHITFAIFVFICLIGVYASTVSGKNKQQ